MSFPLDAPEIVQLEERPLARRTPADALAEALGLAGQLGGRIATVAAEEEVRRVEALLSNPALTPEEAKELEDRASFPLARTRARNRRGELLAEQAYSDLADAVADAPDAPTARQLIREHQQRVLEQAGDGEVAAGIHERFASYAPQLLAEASRRRVERREDAEQLSISADLATTFQQRGAAGYATTLEGLLVDEQLTGGDPDRIHNLSLQTLENQWLEGDDPAFPNQNLNAREVLTTIDGLLSGPTTDDAKTRGKYLELRSQIIRGEEAARTSVASQGRRADQREHLQLTKLATEFRAAGEPIPEFLAFRLRQTASTPAEARAAADFANNLNAPGMSGTSEARAARAQLDTALGKDLLNGKFDAKYAGEAIAFFERSLRSLPKLDDPAERQRVLNELVREADRRGRETVSLREQERAAFDQIHNANLDRLAEQGDEAAFHEYEQSLDERWIKFEREGFEARLNDFLRRAGVSPNNVLRTN